MSFFITDKCVGCTACEIVCPVDAISGVKKALYFIDPKVCIDCGACEPECPVTAIFPEEDTPDNWKSYIAKNRDVFQSATPPGKPQRKGS